MPIEDTIISYQYGNHRSLIFNKCEAEFSVHENFGYHVVLTSSIAAVVSLRPTFSFFGFNLISFLFGQERRFPHCCTHT